jgi:membrane protease YdiL (CAAX protease family)
MPSEHAGAGMKTSGYHHSVVVDERPSGLVAEREGDEAVAQSGTGAFTHDAAMENSSEISELGDERSKIVSWLIIASSWICAFLIFFIGFFLAGFLELFGLSEDVSWELMGILVYIAVLAMTMGYISWDGNLSRTLQMFKIGSFRTGFIFLVGLPFMIIVIDTVATIIYDMLYIMLLGDPYIPEIAYYVDDSEYDLILALSFVSTVIAAPVVEEILFRGYVLDAIREIHGDTVAVLGSAGLFGLLHIEPYVVGYAALGGVIYGLVRIKTGSLWPSIVSHMVWNFLAFLYIWYG